MQVEIARDSISDDVAATATLLDRGAKLTLACDPDDYRGIRVIFTSRHWMAGSSLGTGERALLYRFDEEPPVRLVWLMRDRGPACGARARHRFPARLRLERLLFAPHSGPDRHLFRLSAPAPPYINCPKLGEQRMRRTFPGRP